MSWRTNGCRIGRSFCEVVCSARQLWIHRWSGCAHCRQRIGADIVGKGVRCGGRGLGCTRTFSSSTSVALRASASRGAGQRRPLATVHDVPLAEKGPLDEYDARVAAGRLKNDEYQRGIIQSLQHLHDELRYYKAPPVIHPSFEDHNAPSKSVIARFFGHTHKTKSLQDIPSNLPRGLYLYGDVGCGKTMLMDMFYETLPSNVISKTRIHFHNFMQDVHKRLHRLKTEHGNDFDGVPFVAADLAEQGNVLCFDEFQCTDVADAMILRRLLEALMSHGVVLVTTSNRHPQDLYLNGLQRESFLPCIRLLQSRLHVINLSSPTDYRKIPRPPSGVYHSPLDSHASSHAEKWFKFLGDFASSPPHAELQHVWGRDIKVPRASGKAAMFTFSELIAGNLSAADYGELVRWYDSFIVTSVPGMTYRERDLARRFITFVDAVYESRARLVLTTAVPLTELFLSKDEVRDSVRKHTEESRVLSLKETVLGGNSEDEEVDSTMRLMMDDLGVKMDMLKHSSIFSGDEERFAFARALSRLSEMGSREWVERGMGLERDGGKRDMEGWRKMRSWRMADGMGA